MCAIRMVPFGVPNFKIVFLCGESEVRQHVSKSKLRGSILDVLTEIENAAVLLPESYSPEFRGQPKTLKP